MKSHSLLAAVAIAATLGTVAHERVDVSRHSPAPRPTKAPKKSKAQKKAARKARQHAARQQRR